MYRVTRTRRRTYLGRIEFNEKRIRRWIKYHRGFANKEFLEGQVRYGEWIPRRNKRNCYRIFTSVAEGGYKIARVVIHIIHYPHGDASHSYQYVYIDHAHVLG